MTALSALLAGALVAYLLRKLMKVAMLSWADRMAGAAVGLVVAFLGAAFEGGRHERRVNKIELSDEG